MKSVPPNHLLSAYLDGELSPDEREQVERLLNESPAARQELEELKQVGELLRQLPSDALPKSFASQVLDVCLTDTGQFATETLTEMPAVPASETVQPANSARTWRGVAGLGFSIAAVALVVLVLIFPDGTKHQPTEVADSSSQSAQSLEEDRFTAERSADHAPELMMAPGNGTREEFNSANLAQAESQLDRGVANQPLLPRALQMESPAGLPPADAPERTPWPDAAGLGGGLALSTEPVKVVKVYVGDRQQGLDHLQALLQKQNILREETIPAKPGESPAAESKDATMVAVYVETTEDQFQQALASLQNETAFQDVKREAPIALAQLDSILHPVERKRMIQRFGGAGAGAALPQPLAPSGAGGFGDARMASPQAKDKSQKKFAAKPAEVKKGEAKTKTVPDGKPKPESAAGEKSEPAKKAPAPPYKVADGSPKLNSIRGGLPQDNADAFRIQNAQQAGSKASANRRSRQKQYTLPKALIEQLPKESPEAEIHQEAFKDRTNPPGKRVQVLFILVDQPAKTPLDKSGGK